MTGLLGLITDHPLVALVAALLAALGIEVARRKRAQAKATALQRAARERAVRLEQDLRRLEAAQVEAERRGIAVEVAEAEQRAQEARTAAAAASDDAAEIEAKWAARKKHRNWPTKGVILAAGAALAISSVPALAQEPPADPQAPPAACSPSDPSGLLEALEEVASRLPMGSLDREAAQDAGAYIRLRHDERAALCAELAATGAVVLKLREDIILADRATAIAKESAAGYEAAWRAEMAEPEAKRSCLWGHVLWGLGGAVAGMAAQN